MSLEDLEIYAPIYEFVRLVPSGKVVTYGQIAEEVRGVAFTARQVGTAMRFAPPDVPWQRVIGANGYLPIAKRSPDMYLLQKRLLEQEGVCFLPSETPRIDMARYQWHSQGTPQASLFDEDF